MTETANNQQKNQPAEAPLTWTSSKVHGSQGLTHRAATEINGESWTFTVDSPSKGHWVARAWRDGDFALYREDRTMKGAKQQAQSHADYAATSTCPECHRIGGHKLDCGTGRSLDVAKDAARGTKLGLRDEGAGDDAPQCTRCDHAPHEGFACDPGCFCHPAEATEDTAPVFADHKAAADQQRYVDAYATAEIGPDVLKQLDPEQAELLMAELEETFPHLAEWKRNVLGDRAKRAMSAVVDAAQQMEPVVMDAAESIARMSIAVERVQAARDRVQLRKDTCGCRTPLHTMRCGTGGRARVIAKAGA